MKPFLGIVIGRIKYKSFKHWLENMVYLLLNITENSIKLLTLGLVTPDWALMFSGWCLARDYAKEFGNKNNIL
jgi:hypothetical protein